MKPHDVVNEVQSRIESLTRRMSDEDYLAVLDAIEDYCRAAAYAKREEQRLKKEDE